MDDKLIARFWSKVDKRGADECWPWLGTRDKDGYGKIYGVRRHLRAHRLSVWLIAGVEPTGLVCHTCDVPSCVNPAHLFVGTPLDNMRDKIAKGRARYECGEDHHGARLTAAAVVEIRRRLEAGERGCDLAVAFDVGRPIISMIKHRRTWSRGLSLSATGSQECSLPDGSET